MATEIIARRDAVKCILISSVVGVNTTPQQFNSEVWEN